MTFAFKLVRRITRLRAATVAALLGVAVACDNESLNPSSADDMLPEGSDVVQVADPAFSIATRRRGVPYGFWNMEYSQLSDLLTSLERTSHPDYVRRQLEGARSRGGRVVLSLAGGPRQFKNSNGTFSLDKFKQALNRYKGINLGSYITDGTLAANLMFDEPNNPAKWGGRAIPHSTVEAAAKHSKSIWSNLPVLVRARPSWLAKASFTWRYLDGGWAQYVSWFGNVTNFRDNEVRIARNEGLKVVFGLNVLDGGNGSSGWRGTKRGRWTMSPTESRTSGQVLIPAGASCGFLMWRIDGTYVGRRGVKDALQALRSLAGNLATPSCRSS
jgi:hypothetical protein